MHAKVIIVFNAWFLKSDISIDDFYFMPAVR